MYTRRMEVPLPAVNEGLDYGILTEKAPIFEYQNGKKASDTPIGLRLTIALPGSRLAQLSVKFDHDPLPKVSDEQIAQGCLTSNYLYVQIRNCTVTLYNSDNGIGMTATAQEAQIVELNRK